MGARKPAPDHSPNERTLRVLRHLGDDAGDEVRQIRGPWGYVGYSQGCANALVAEITGYTDQTGDPEKNKEIAKERAKAVHEQLKAAGVAESRLRLQPPSSVMTGAGADAEARRVEIMAKK